MVEKVIQAAMICKNMVFKLENMDTIPGYIIYEEFQEDGKEDLLTKDDKKENKVEEIQEQQKEEKKEIEYE